MHTRFPSRTSPRPSHCPLRLAFFLVSGILQVSDAHTPGHPRETSPPPSMVRGPVHAHIVGFLVVDRVSMGTLTGHTSTQTKSSVHKPQLKFHSEKNELSESVPLNFNF